MLLYKKGELHEDLILSNFSLDTHTITNNNSSRNSNVMETELEHNNITEQIDMDMEVIIYIIEILKVFVENDEEKNECVIVLNSFKNKQVILYYYIIIIFL